jgi:hypothetical protein
MAEEEDENGWGAGYLYKAPDYIEGTHPMEIDGAVTWRHVWVQPPVPTIKKDGECP